MLMKKFLSVVLSMAMIMSICTVISPTLTASAEESTSQSDSLYNDFSSWKAEKSKGYYQWTGTWSVEDDSGVAGGKYLRFWHWENTDNYNPNSLHCWRHFELRLFHRMPAQWQAPD